jgi:hypothetical protein
LEYWRILLDQLAAAVRAARFKAQSEEGDEDDEDVTRRKKKVAAKPSDDKDDEDEGDDGEKRKDAEAEASAEFARRFAIAGAKRRGELPPEPPTDPVARTIIAAGRRARGEA